MFRRNKIRYPHNLLHLCMIWVGRYKSSQNNRSAHCHIEHRSHNAHLDYKPVKCNLIRCRNPSRLHIPPKSFVRHPLNRGIPKYPALTSPLHILKVHCIFRYPLQNRKMCRVHTRYHPDKIPPTFCVAPPQPYQQWRRCHVSCHIWVCRVCVDA